MKLFSAKFFWKKTSDVVYCLIEIMVACLYMDMGWELGIFLEKNIVYNNKMNLLIKIYYASFSCLSCVIKEMFVKVTFKSTQKPHGH